MSQQDFPYTEEALIVRFAERHCRDIRYSPDHKCFFIYEGKRWIRDDTMIIFNRAGDMLMELRVYCNRETNMSGWRWKAMNDATNKFMTVRTTQNMVRGVKALITISADELDELNEA